MYEPAYYTKSIWKNNIGEKYKWWNQIASLETLLHLEQNA